MTNNPLPELSMYKDVMTRNNARMLSMFMPKKKVLETIQHSTRENARTPLQWSDRRNAGFSTAEPWFPINDNYHHVNVQAQEEDPDSLLNFYRKLLRFRKDNPIVLYGRYRELMEEHSQLYVYERFYRSQKLLVICSFTNELVRFELPEDYPLDKGRLVLSNYEHNFVIANGFTTRPYELRVYMFEEEKKCTRSGKKPTQS